MAIDEAEVASTTEAARRERQVAEKAQVERDAQWRKERAGLQETCRQAQERCTELEAALARQQDEIAASERRDASLRAELNAARIRAHDDPEQALAKAELDQVQASHAEAETSLQATRNELTLATDRIAALSKTHDEIMTDRCRLAAELAIAEERAADLARRVDELTGTGPPSSRPIPF